MVEQINIYILLVYLSIVYYIFFVILAMSPERILKRVIFIHPFYLILSRVIISVVFVVRTFTSVTACSFNISKSQDNCTRAWIFYEYCMCRVQDKKKNIETDGNIRECICGDHRQMRLSFIYFFIWLFIYLFISCIVPRCCLNIYIHKIIYDYNLRICLTYFLACALKSFIYMCVNKYRRQY